MRQGHVAHPQSVVLAKDSNGIAELVATANGKYTEIHSLSDVPFHAEQARNLAIVDG